MVTGSNCGNWLYQSNNCVEFSWLQHVLHICYFLVLYSNTPAATQSGSESVEGASGNLGSEGPDLTKTSS